MLNLCRDKVLLPFGYIFQYLGDNQKGLSSVFDLYSGGEPENSNTQFPVLSSEVGKEDKRPSRTVTCFASGRDRGIRKEDTLNLSRTALIEVLQCKKAEIEHKRAETLSTLDAQIAVLQSSMVSAAGTGTRSAVTQPGVALRKLVDVRADAARRFEDAMQEIVKQEQSWLGNLTTCC